MHGEHLMKQASTRCIRQMVTYLFCLCYCLRDQYFTESVMNLCQWNPDCYITILYTILIKCIKRHMRATEALYDSQSGGIKQKRFQMFLKIRVLVAQLNI